VFNDAQPINACPYSSSPSSLPIIAQPTNDDRKQLTHSWKTAPRNNGDLEIGLKVTKYRQ